MPETEQLLLLSTVLGDSDKKPFIIYLTPAIQHIKCSSYLFENVLNEAVKLANIAAELPFL